MNVSRQFPQIDDEVWRSAFLASPQPMLIATLDEDLIEVNNAARDLLNLEYELVICEKVHSLLKSLPPAIRKLIRVQRVSVQIAQVEYLLLYLQDAREQIHSERLLSFFATTLKSLDYPSSVSTDLEKVLSEAAEVAVENMCEWCRIDLRQDLYLGTGVVAHSNKKLLGPLQELQKISLESPDDLLNPSKVIRSGVAVLKENVSDQLLKVLSVASKSFSLLQKVGLQSYMCVPIKKSNDTIGSITFARSSKSPEFDPVDLMMAEEFAIKVGINLERALLYKNLAEMKNAAESANRAKTNFLANVSHEIRTPLGAILGFSELLVGTHSSLAERHEWGNKIRSNSRHLLRIIDDILDLSKVEMGKLGLEIKPLDLRDFLLDLHGIACSKLVSNDVVLDFVIQGSLPRFIKSDSTRLSQILSNILGNAIKFTSHGHVRLTVSRQTVDKDDGASTGQLVFEVEDSGIGLSETQASLLFQPFSQADASHTRRFGGTGLGLALSRNLARSLGGDLILKSSKPGLGSKFVITIPLSEVPESEKFHELFTPSRAPIVELKEEDLSTALEAHRILLVEDSTDIQLLVKRFLEGAGAEILVAANGEDGVRVAQSDNFDAVLMDVQMPIMDGCQATKTLRDKGYDGLIIALTANAMKEEHDRCLEAGYDAHLSKPIRRQDLIRNILHLSKSHKRKLAPTKHL